MEIFYINLDRDVDRRVRFDDHLRQLGLSATRVQALTPADISPEIIAENCDASRLQHVMPEELACTMSHRRAWQQMLDRKLEFALFLEDDVMLSTRLVGFLKRVPPVLRRYGLLHIEAHRWQIGVGPQLTAIGKIGLHRALTFNYGTGGYLLTAKVARRLLDGLASLNYCVDDTLFNPDVASCRALRPVQAVPALVANGGVLAKLTGTVHPSSIRDVRLARIARREASLQALSASSVWNTAPLRPVRAWWEGASAKLTVAYNVHIRRMRTVKMTLAGAKRRPG